MEWQKAHPGQYELVDLVQEYVSSNSDKTLRTLKMEHTCLRSFFLHNRCELPNDKAFKVRSEKAGSPSLLSLEHHYSVG